MHTICLVIVNCVIWHLTDLLCMLWQSIYKNRTLCVFDRLCVKMPNCRTTGLTTILHCQVMVSRMPTMQHCGHLLALLVVSIPSSWH